MNQVVEHWDEILKLLRAEFDISNLAYNTWLAPLTISKVNNDTVYILVEHATSLEHYENRYKKSLQVCIAGIIGKEYEVVFVSENQNEIATKKNITDKARKINANYDNVNLNSRYTFDNFVVGKNNEFTHGAALGVSKSPANMYNPLFIYGGVGLGKTHLMHSIAHYILENDPNKKVLYVTSESFTNELIEVLRAGRTSNEQPMSSFRNKYRNIDVLLIDDIQFIIGKTSTQEEFFHTFNELHLNRKQVINSSDKPPKEFEDLEDRLKTRFGMGLIANISSPDYETRMAILHKKIEMDGLDHLNIPDEVINYIADHIKTNIRDLEGSLMKVIALYRLGSRDFDINLAAEALKDFISPDGNREVTPEIILNTVAEHYNISVKDLESNKRNATINRPRQIIMYLCRTLTDAPLKSIGIMLGGRDHSTISNGINNITAEIEVDEKLKNTIDIISRKINPI